MTTATLNTSMSSKAKNASVLKALERIERRTAEVLYESQKWFDWVRECQVEEETTRDKEQKKVKLEAAMFRRNKVMVDMRTKERKAREDKRRGDAFWRSCISRE